MTLDIVDRNMQEMLRWFQNLWNCSTDTFQLPHIFQKQSSIM